MMTDERRTRADTLAKIGEVLDVPVSSLFFESAEENAHTGDAVSQLSEELRRSVDETIKSVCLKSFIAHW
jgi:hypothetical protein